VEVIIIDDGSSVDQRADRILGQFNLRVDYTFCPRESRTWVNPCVPFNIGFKKAFGDVIIFQNPECFHVGDVIGYAARNLNNNYFVFSCKNLTELDYREMKKHVASPAGFDQYIETLKYMNHGWYCHPKSNPTGYHFLAAIERRNLEAMGGFDERYAQGYSFDDDEFLARIKRSPFALNIIPPDQCFGVHQWHECTHPPGGCAHAGWKKNHNLFTEVTKPGTFWKANDVGTL
jgi:hypothetical protein